MLAAASAESLSAAERSSVARTTSATPPVLDALTKDTPEHRTVQRPSEGRVVEVPRVGGLHHEYRRRAA
jgi:hypothetical protein